MKRNKFAGIIILAAGQSSRFGKPKQLAEFQGQTMIRRAVKNAFESNCAPVITVLGANFDLIKHEIENCETEIVFNNQWQSGMSSSIKAGLEKLLEFDANISGAIISLADQPFVSSDIYHALINKFHETNKQIIASRYNGLQGVPAFFSSELFPALLNLEGDKGAKEFIKNNSRLVETISVPEAEIDIDTEADFDKLKNDAR